MVRSSPAGRVILEQAATRPSLIRRELRLATEGPPLRWNRFYFQREIAAGEGKLSQIGPILSIRRVIDPLLLRSVPAALS